MNLSNLVPPKPEPEPSWRALMGLIKTMTWAERKSFLSMALLPYPQRSENINMWIICGLYLAAYGIAGHAIIRTLMSTHVPGELSPIFLSGFIAVVLFDSFVRSVLTQLNKGVQARKTHETRAMMAEIQRVVDNYGKDIVERLKAASGRESIDMNPISMAAASLDIHDKHAASANIAKTNPLKAALADELHATDLLDTNPDEPTH